MHDDDDDDGGVAQDGCHTPNNRLTETCSLGLLCTSLILGIHVMYHMTISWVQVYSSSRSSVFLKLTADQVLVFDWIAGSCLVNLLKTGQDCSRAS